MTHLRPEARDLVLLPAADRLARIPANRWIGYTRANQAIALLGRMLANEPGRIRPRNLLIIGPTNNGKTAIAEHFLRDYPQRRSEDDEHEVFPVLLVQMPPAPTVSRLYAAILAGLGVPGALHPRSPDREGAALYLLRRVECRMLVLDELHNLLAASIPRQRELLNLLRYLSPAGPLDSIEGHRLGAIAVAMDHLRDRRRIHQRLFTKARQHPAVSKYALINLAVAEHRGAVRFAEKQDPASRGGRLGRAPGWGSRCLGGCPVRARLRPGRRC
jgi:hypothetical protein